MFRCELCNKKVGPRIPAHLIVEQRPYQHPHRTKVGQKWQWDEKKNQWKWSWYDDFGGFGKQIVKETKVCPACEAKHAAKSARAEGVFA